jgi:riboflavin kinase/FMN adenylyltransferase
MEIVYQLDPSLKSNESIMLTIGNFDGVHKGHQAVLTRLKEIAQHRHKKATVVTFTNPPYTLLHPDQPQQQLCTLAHKIALLDQAGIDRLILLPFTHELSKLSAEDFLKYMHTSYPIDTLLLGYDAVIGKQREGNRDTIKELAASMHFELEYLEPILVDETIVSSSQIRQYIQVGDLHRAELMLGRKHSIYSIIVDGAKIGKKLGFPTANINLKDLDLCLPPLGVYAVVVKIGDESYQGAANIGIAPTVRNSLDPILEVYLFDFAGDLYNRFVEVILYAFIRPEIKFSNLDELKKQIQEDVGIIQSSLKDQKR